MEHGHDEFAFHRSVDEIANVINHNDRVERNFDNGNCYVVLP